MRSKEEEGRGVAPSIQKLRMLGGERVRGESRVCLERPLFHSPRQTDTYSLSLHNRGWKGNIKKER